MRRRDFVIGTGAALIAAGCATAQLPGGKRPRIRVETQGTGPDVLLVPGLGSSPEVWRELAAALPGYRYHFVQVLGFAGTPIEGNAEAGPPVAGIAEAIARYIESARLERPALIGHSMGGTIGMMVAARYPQHLSKLMVVDMIPFMGAMFGPPGTTPESVRPTADAMRDRMAASTGAARQKPIEDMIATMVKAEDRRAIAVKHSLDSDAGLSARAMHELIVTDLRPELGRIKVPMTVLYVRAPNVPFTDELMDGFYKLSFAAVPQVKLKRIPDAWHYIMWDQPKLFADEVKAFLAG